MTAQPSPEVDCEIPVAGAAVPLSHELLWGLDWLALRASKVYRGEGVPRGHGEPVIVVPGFLGSYHGLHELTDWLARSGYAVSDPGFERNVACPDTLLERLEGRIAGEYAAHGRPVSLVGHSLGGSLARAAAARMPEHISHVITLGSPLREMRAHPLVAELARLAAALAPSPHRTHAGHEHGPTCSCELADALAQPLAPGIRRTAIFSRRDGVVDWRTSMEGDASVDVEVGGTHIGLAVNPRAYAAIALALASQPQPQTSARAPGRDGASKPAVAMAGGASAARCR
ncbi:MAG: alpha/beta fold hydrolase [Chloroflexota bacterium]|nr:alpha/beta fold hydrolase [Chloroflexota bacterium]